MRAFRVKKDTKCGKLAGAIAAVIQEEESLELSVMGKDAIKQAIKGIAIARTYIAPLGFDLDSKPSIEKITVDGVKKVAIRIEVGRISI